MSETIQIHRGSHYIAVPGDICRDIKARGITAKMIGLYTYIYNLPAEEWRFTVPGLASRMVEGEQTIRRILNALRSTGYVTMKRTKNSEGKYESTEWHIYDRPVKDEDKTPVKHHRKKPYDQKPHMEKPNVENAHDNDNYHNMILSSSACAYACVSKANLPELTDMWIEEVQMMISRQLRKRVTQEEVRKHYEEFKSQITAEMADSDLTNEGEIRRHFANYIRKRININNNGNPTNQNNHQSDEASRADRQQQYANGLSKLLSGCK